MDQRIIDLWHEFTHGGMDRRDFMHGLAGMARSMTGAVALIPFFNPHLRTQVLLFIA